MPNPNTAVPAIPALANITDPNVRMALQAMATNWEVRNGNSPNKGERFVKLSEITGLAQQATMQLFGVSKGAPGDGTPITGSDAANMVDNLANAVAQSFLFQRLGQRIPLLSIPDKIFGQLDRVQTVNEQRFQQQVDRDSATNERVTTLAVKVDNAQAGVQDEATVRAQKDMAIASAISRIWASIGGDPPHNDFTALIQDSQMAAATPAAAQATRYTTLQSAVFDPNTGTNNIASLQQSFSTYVSAVDGKMNTLYTIQTQLSTNGQTVVGGFGLAGSVGGGLGPTIDFGVRADKFFIAATAGTPDGATQIAQGSTIPFMVITSTQVIGGVTYPPGVYIKNAVIATAAIGTANIQDAAILTAKIADGQITTAKIQDATITNAKIQNAAVGTLTLQGEAVTIPRQAINSFVSVGTGETTLVSVYVVGGASAVAVFGNVSAMGPSGTSSVVTSFTFNVYRDGVLLNSTNGSLGPNSPTGGGGYPLSSSIIGLDTYSGGGTYTLTAQGAGQYYNATIVCIGCKR